MMMTLGLIATVVLVAGCGATKTSNRDIDFVNSDEAQALVGRRQNLVGKVSEGVWVDPRTEAAFAKKHLPGAINLPFQNVTDDHAMLDDYGTLVVYGDTFNDAKAQGMAKRLIELGHEDVHLLRGGIEAWMDLGLPVEGTDVVE
ncbi:MAG: rhodanese-like domain-containing protein [Planctomycetota bacterium]